MDGRWRSSIVSGILFAGIFLARVALPEPGDGVLFLLVLPIALVALEFGLLGGLIGAAVATSLLALWTITSDIHVSAIGVATRMASFTLAGIGIGLLAEERNKRDERLRTLLDSAARHTSALEVHERVVQSLAVAKMALEMGEDERAAGALEDALRNARSFVSSGVEPESGSLRSEERGTLT